MFLAAREVLKIIADNLKKAVGVWAVSQRLIPTEERACLLMISLIAVPN